MPRYEKRVDVSPRTIANTFKKHFANLASDLVKKLPDPTGKFGIPSARQYYKRINFREKKLKFEKVSSVSILKILKEFKANKTTGADNLARSFLKDGPNTLYTLQLRFVILLSNSPLSQINTKLQKLSLCIEKVSKLTQRISGPSRCFHLFLRLQNKLFMIKL